MMSFFAPIGAFLFILFALVPFALVVAVVRYAIKWFRGPPPPNSRREQRFAAHLEAWRAAEGIIPGAVVASILFPTSDCIAAYVHAFWVEEHQAALGQEVAREIVLSFVATGEVFLFFAIFWGLGIALLLPIWEVLYRCGARGPVAAAALGAAASLGIALAIPLLQSFAFFAPSQLAFLTVMATTGAAGGTVVWWAAYRPEAIWACLRRCPVSKAGS